MTHFDVFNGDADGLCSLQQLRLAAPRVAVAVSGTKREVTLLQRVDAMAGDTVTVLDISLDANRDALVALLDRGVSVEYFDHHHAGRIPDHPGLVAHIDPSPRVCTATLVDRHLRGAQRLWAVVGAFGDNLPDAARELAGPLAPGDRELARLRELGEALNYNGYGDKASDLIVHPVALYRLLAPYADPFGFMDAEPAFATIARHRDDDMTKAALAAPERVLAGATIYVLPDAPWSRRVRGAFANALASGAPQLAHAVLTRNDAGGYTVSVRTPLAPGTPADAVCRMFPTGGGRAAAAGINHLPTERLPEFVRALDRAFPG